MLCFIFSLQAVAAADVDVNDTDETALATTDVDVVEQSNNLSSLTLPANDEVLSDGEGSFTDLQNDLSGQTEVTLTRNYTYQDSDSSLKGGIPLSGSIKIIGNGNIVIDAKNQARIFNITAGSTVTLQGITFINGYANNCTIISTGRNQSGPLEFAFPLMKNTRISIFNNSIISNGSCMITHFRNTVKGMSINPYNKNGNSSFCTIFSKKSFGGRRTENKLPETMKKNGTQKESNP